MKEKMFTNQKETDRAIKAAVDQFRKVLKKKHQCVVCGCTVAPDEWSVVAENCCFDCA